MLQKSEEKEQAEKQVKSRTGTDKNCSEKKTCNSLAISCAFRRSHSDTQQNALSSPSKQHNRLYEVVSALIHQHQWWESCSKFHY